MPPTDRSETMTWTLSRLLALLSVGAVAIVLGVGASGYIAVGAARGSAGRARSPR